MQTGACDAAMTSSTSLISFRLEEVAKSLTTGRGKSYWFMLEPLIMSKQIFDAMPKGQRDIIMALGEELEKFGTKEAMADDQKVAEVYAKKGAKVADLDEAIVDKWRVIARDTAWKDYAKQTPLSAELLQLAERVTVSWRSPVSGPGKRGFHGSRLRRRRARRRRRPIAGAGGPVGRLLAMVNGVIVALSSVALVAAALRSDLQRRQPLLPAPVDRLAGRALGVPDRRRRLHVGGGDPGAARPCRHRGDRRAPVAAREPLAPVRASTSRASCSAPSSRGSPGCCSMRPGRRTSTRNRPGARRCGFPTR